MSTLISRLAMRRLGYAMGIEITGVDATRPLDEQTITTIRQAWLDHILVCLPGQDLTATQLKDFSAQFGPLEDYSVVANRDPEMPEVLVVANQPVVVNGQVKNAYKTAAAVWHSDYEHNVNPTRVAFLLGKDLPDVGGDTMFANMYMAYEALSPAFQAMIEPLCGVRDYKLSPAYRNSTPEEQAKMRALKPPVVHRLVRTNPETARKTLFFSERLRNFIGMTEDETKPLVDFLMAHALRPEFLYRHRWTKNDLVIWDNHAAMHIAVQDYDHGQFRRMLQTSIAGPQTGYLYQDDAG